MSPTTEKLRNRDLYNFIISSHLDALTTIVTDVAGVVLKSGGDCTSSSDTTQMNSRHVPPTQRYPREPLSLCLVVSCVSTSSAACGPAPPPLGGVCVDVRVWMCVCIYMVIYT